MCWLRNPTWFGGTDGGAALRRAVAAARRGAGFAARVVRARRGRAAVRLRAFAPRFAGALRFALRGGMR